MSATKVSAVVSATFLLAACTQTTEGPTFKDGDFECSGGKREIEIKPPDWAGSLLDSLSTDIVNDGEPDQEAKRTMEIARRMMLCRGFLADDQQEPQ